MFLTLLFLHLLAAGTLFAGLGLELTTITAVHRAATASQLRAALTNEHLIGPLMGGGGGMLLLFGAGAVYAGGFGWQAWNIVAAVVTILLLAIGGGVNGRRAEAFSALAAAAPDGPLDAQIQAARADGLWTYCTMLMPFEIVAVLYLMSNKPAAAPAIIAVVAAAILAIVPTAALLKRSKTATAYAQ